MYIELVQTTESDRDYLLCLRKLTMVEHFENVGLLLSDDEHSMRVNDAFECFYTILSSGERVGAIKYREHDDKIEIMQVQIHPDYQGRGLGKTVIEKVLAHAKSTLKFVELTVLKANPARQLYERLGFKIVGDDEYEFHMEWLLLEE